jgi:putative chitinase
MLTLDAIQRLAPACDAEATLAALSAAAEEFSITDLVEQAMWLGQLSVESGGFVRLEEDLSYSAQRLMAVWPNRFPTPASAESYVHSPRRLADRVYGARLGNNEIGDGWRFRGRGYIQTTGRANYALTSAGIGLDLMSDPDQLSRPDIAARAAGFFWSHHDLGPLARAGDITGVTRKINGGLIGLADRQAAFMHARDLLGETRPAS